MSLSHEFWNIVGEPADVDDLKVGDAIRLEHGPLRAVKIVVEVWDEPNKGRQIRIRDPRSDEIYRTPTITVVTK